MTSISKSLVFVVLVSLVVTAAALARSSATAVSVTAGKPSEFHFTLSKKSVTKGAVTFTITNKGKLEHDFKINGKTSK